MSETPHILILGAGLIGLCSAHELAARGARVTVMDGRPGPCEGTSFSNSGMIHPSQARSWAPGAVRTQADRDAARVTVKLAQRSTARLLPLMAQLDLPERPSGCVQIVADMAAAQALCEANTELGIRTDILIDPVETFGQVACHFPDDRSGDARAFGCALAADLAARGVTFIYGATDPALRRTSDGFALRSGDVILNADQLVIAAGAGSPGLLGKLGLRLQLDAVSGAAADFDKPADFRLPSRPVMDTQSRSALTVFEDRVRISGGWQVTDPAVLIARWAEIAPDLLAALGAPRRSWTAKRPVSPAGRPYISATSVPGLWVNTGHGHMGWTLCAGSGELLAEMMLEGREAGAFAFAG